MTIAEHIKQDAIAGHEAAIAKLEKSIAERSAMFSSIRYIAPSFRIAMSKIHVKELEQLEILKLELFGIREFGSNGS